MRLFDVTLFLILTIVGVCVVGGLISEFFLGKDNPIEQEAEQIIHEETGLSIDLSP